MTCSYTKLKQQVSLTLSVAHTFDIPTRCIRYNGALSTVDLLNAELVLQLEIATAGLTVVNPTPTAPKTTKPGVGAAWATFECVA
jgi:hypothetical protein